LPELMIAGLSEYALAVHLRRVARMRTASANVS